MAMVMSMLMQQPVSSHRTNNRSEAMNNASWRNIESHPAFYHLLEAMSLEVKRSRRLVARAEEGAVDVVRVREQNRQV